MAIFFHNLRLYVGMLMHILGIHPQTPSHHVAHILQPLVNSCKKASNAQFPALSPGHPMHPDNAYVKVDKVDKGKVCLLYLDPLLFSFDDAP